MPERFPIAVLVSGNGTNLQALIDRLHMPADSPVEIVLVVTSSADAPAVGRVAAISPTYIRFYQLRIHLELP